MKKLVLVMVCAVVMTIFIAFNYVLWDRENKIKSFEDINITNNASINALAKENKSLNDTNSQLKDSIDHMKDVVSQYEAANGQLKQDNLKLTQDNAQKNDVIDKLVQAADLKPLEAVIRKWAENMDKGQYEEAFRLQKNETINNGEALNLNDFISTYKNSVKEIKVKDVKFDPDKTANEKSGEIIFDITLEVKIAENSGKSVYIDGQNQRVFSLFYDKGKDSWLISNITTE